MSESSEDVNQREGGAEGSLDAPDGSESGGQPHGAELARQALEQAKADARSRGAAADRQAGRRTGRGRAQGARRQRASPSRDPLTLSSAIEELLADRGWELQTSIARVFARWPEIVGEELAAHTRPESFDEGELVVSADSAAWATQVRLLSSSLVQRLGRELGELGEGAIDRVKVRGPSRPAAASRVSRFGSSG